jgi:peptidyl-prolyl cis-trans isomerase B (cyclophilin B)
LVGSVKIAHVTGEGTGETIPGVKTMKKSIILLLSIALVLTISACASNGGKKVEKNPVVTITMEDSSTIKIELYPDKAPNTVNSFISLVNKGFYDGLTFHRIIDGFMIQGGDPEGTGRGGPGYMIKGEFAKNGFKQNDLKHTKGVISMARGGDPNYDSAGSQFFIMVGDSSQLDGNYAAFGKVVDDDSLNVCLKLAKTPTSGGQAGAPYNPPKMKTVTVDTFGVKYPEPEIIKK